VIGRLRALVARDPLLVAAFALLWAASLVPIWAPRHLPLLDLPRHLAAAQILSHFRDATTGYARFYELNLLPLPYWGWLAPVRALALMMPVAIASKLVLSAYALALPLGCALLARRMGRSPWLALFIFPFVFNMNVGYGFVAFVVGLAILPFALWALDRFLDEPSLGRGVALSLLTLAIYFAHVLPWMFFGLAALLQLACHGKKPRAIAAAAGLMLPSLAVAVSAFRMAARTGTDVQRGPLAIEGRWLPAVEVMRDASSQLTIGWPESNRALQVLIGLFVIWLVLLLSARTDARDTAASQHGWRFRFEIICGLCALMPLVLPAHLEKPVDLWMIGGRFVSLAAIFTLLLPHGPIAGRRKLLFIPVVALCLYYPLALGGKWLAFDKRAQAARRLIHHIPRGKSTLTLVVGDGSDPAVDIQFAPYLAFHAYPQLYAGGFDPWALDTGFPMRVRPGRALPSPHFRHPEEFTFEQHGRHYDYLLTLREPRDNSLFMPSEVGVARMVGSDGEWRLYEVRK
jgi:hypothetical protein